MPYSRRVKGLLCGFAATLMWASVYPVSRYLFGKEADNFDEWFVAYLRVAIAVLFLLPFTIKGGDWGKFKRSWRGDWKMLFLLALAATAEDLLLFISLKYTTAARSSVMANTSPVFTLLFSVLLAKELFSRWKLAGVILGFIGIVIAFVSRGGDIFVSGISTFSGDMLALSSGVVWAVFTVAGDQISEKYDGIFCVAILRILGLFLMIPILLIFNCRISFDIPFPVWIGIIYLGCCPSGLAVGLWRHALKFLPPGELGAFGYISALSAISFSVIFLKEKITWDFAAAVLCILAGVSLMLRQSKK